ncbi:hypothetical protein EGW08_007837, partial [Elysia chlorotica]
MNFNILMAEQRHQERDHTTVNDHLDLAVPTVSQVRQSPHSVNQNLKEETQIKLTQSREDFLYRVFGWRGVFVAAQIHNYPRHVAQERQRDAGIDEGQQVLHCAQLDHIVSALRAVT